MRFLTFITKRLLALILLNVTLGQALMPAEIAYARKNDPTRFVLSLEKAWEQKIDQRQANLVFRTLHLFPQSFYKSLNHVVLQLKGGHGARGRANSERIILQTNRMSDPEMISVFIHELAHVYDLGTVVGTRKARRSRFKFKNGQYVASDDPSTAYYDIAWASSERYKRGINKTKHFVSTYGASSPFEDFGEAFAFYVLHGDEFLRRAKTNSVLKAKYEHLWIKVFGGNRFAFGTNKRYPTTFFDVTKLPYDFAKLLSFADKKRRQFAREENARRRRNSRKRNRLRRQARVRLTPITSSGS